MVRHGLVPVRVRRVVPQISSVVERRRSVIILRTVGPYCQEGPLTKSVSRRSRHTLVYRESVADFRQANSRSRSITSTSVSQ